MRLALLLLLLGASLSDQANFPHYDAGQRAAAPYLYSFGSVASFSSVGPTEDGRRAPTVVAPGVSMRVSMGEQHYETRGYVKQWRA